MVDGAYGRSLAEKFCLNQECEYGSSSMRGQEYLTEAKRLAAHIPITAICKHEMACMQSTDFLASSAAGRQEG